MTQQQTVYVCHPIMQAMENERQHRAQQMHEQQAIDEHRRRQREADETRERDARRSADDAQMITQSAVIAAIVAIL